MKFYLGQMNINNNRGINFPHNFQLKTLNYTTMKKLNFDKLMSFNPTLLSTMTNQIGQRVNFYEHPTKGDEYTVLGVFPDFKIAFDTDHWDTSEFYNNSDYNPIYKDGEVLSAFEVILK